MKKKDLNFVSGKEGEEQGKDRLAGLEAKQRPKQKERRKEFNGEGLDCGLVSGHILIRLFGFGFGFCFGFGILASSLCLLQILSVRSSVFKEKKKKKRKLAFNF